LSNQYNPQVVGIHCTFADHNKYSGFGKCNIAYSFPLDNILGIGVDILIKQDFLPNKISNRNHMMELSDVRLYETFNDSSLDETVYGM